jgi:DNA topoisomerase VI subunit A
LHILLSAAPPNATVSDVLADLGFDNHQDGRRAKTLAYGDCKTTLEWLRATHKPVPPEKLGRLGQDAYDYDGYGCKLGEMVTPAGAHVPYVIEVWAEAEASEKKVSEVEVILFVNRTRALAPLHATAVVGGGIKLRGCSGLDRWIELKSARYKSVVSILTPYVQLAGDGKEPVLPPFGNTIEEALKRACNAAYRLMDKSAASLSIKEAAYLVMEEAYQKASGEGQYPANARQIMYAARPTILELTGREKLDDQYFTQKLLPDFQNDNPDLTEDWKTAYDARGHFIEPHTNHEIGLGTIEVQNYLDSKVEMGAAVNLAHGQLYPTRGPSHRYETILFIEKEGFLPLMEAAQIAERFDVGIMSTKGMSVTAARQLLDKLSEGGHLKNLLVLRDFDVYAFSIFGTLFTDTRRYTFSNEVQVVDLGLRLSDVQELGLEGESYEVKDWDARLETLRRHGATEEEIEFLRTQRVELNAMTAPEFVAFLEKKLAFHAKKVVPDKAVIEAHARRIWEQLQAQERCKEILEAIHAESATAELPRNLVAQVKRLLKKESPLSWDQAVAKVLGKNGSAR